MTVSNSRFSTNNAISVGNEGGAIYNDAVGTLTVDKCAFISNWADSKGGAIYNSGTLNISDSVFNQNSARNGEGGAIYHNSGTATIKNTTLHQNTAETAAGYGGAISNHSTLTLLNSTLSDNSATGDYGGGIKNGSGTLTMTNSTLSGNSASGFSGQGGGIYIESGATLISGNSLIAGNIATLDGPEIYNADTFTSNGNNLVGFNSTPGVVGVTLLPSSDFTPTVPIGSIITSLGDNGGPLLPYNGPVRLGMLTFKPLLGAVGETAIDVGNNTLAASLPTDQRGAPRIYNTTVDIGAMEVGTYPLTVIPLGAGSGTVSDSATINCPGTCKDFFPTGTSVTLNASASGGSTFTGWSGGGCSGTGTCVVTMNSAYLVTATFDLTGNYTVLNNNDIGSGSLRQAIASGASTISFDASLSGQTITLGSEIGISSDVTINGLGAANLAVSGNNNSRIFNVTAGNVTINGLTLKNGNATAAPTPRGGAILNSGVLTINNSVLDGNRAQSGGAIRNLDSTGQLTITNSTLSNNIATSGGGGAVVNTSAATTSAVKIQNCTVSGNTATEDGGALFNSSPGTMSVIASTVSGNTSAKGGGGIANSGSTATLTVRDSTLSGNTANGVIGQAGGGGIYNSTGTVQVINSTLSGNRAPNNVGGGIENNGPLTITNSTMAYNIAATDGGGINNGSGVLTIGNSLIAGNIPAGKEIHVVGGTFTLQGKNLFGVNNVSGLSGLSPTGTGTYTVPAVGVLIGNIINDLLPNGGSTLTHLPLPGLPGSTAIDAGDDLLATAAGLTTDQRGAVRSIGSAVDIGAVESAILTTFTVNASVIGANGTISPASQIVNAGSTTTFTVDPSPGYVATVGGTCGGSLAGNTYTTNAITANCTVEASFSLAPAFVVTNLNDIGAGSLRDVIGLANTTPGPNTITFTVTGTIPLSTGEIAITDDLTINGPGANAITVSGGGLSRIFTVASGKTVTISGLTLSNGIAANDGGALVNNGNLTISDSAVSGNTAAWGGGGIANASSASILTIRNSTLSGNTANSGSSGHGGGAVFNYLGSVTVINSTVSGNSVPTNTGGRLDNYGSMTVTNSTITGNSASYGGGIYTENALTVGNSLIAGNSASVLGPEIRVAGSGTLNSQGYNLFGENGVHGLSGALPKADPDGDLVLPGAINTAISTTLANNGSATLTHLPTATSLTINTGSNALIPSGVTADQRGAVRSIGSAVDIGAVEDLNGTNIHLLKVIRAGTGSGTVTGSGIACGATCLANVTGSPDITLAANPLPGSSFVGWSGDCTTDPCTVALDQARTVTATFNTLTSFLVTNLSDSGAGSLRQVMADANVVPGSNTVIFDASLTGGAITLTGGEIAISDDVIIDGLGAANLAVSGNNASRIFTVAAGKTVEIHGLTLKDGRSANAGGAILNDGILTVSDSALNTNTSTTTSGFSGGGAIANNGTLTVTDSSLTGNTAAIGGAINNQVGGTATLRNSTLSSNSATGTGVGGGAIFNRGITLTVDACTLSSNTAVFKGGGVFAWASSTTTTEVTHSTIVGNTAKSGGGIANQDAGSTLKVLNSTLSGNTSNGGVGYGGAGLFNLSGTVEIINSTVSGNPSTHTGGGLDNYGSMTVANSTITGNSATYGGGIYTENALTVGNSLIAGNSASVLGPEIRVAGSGTLNSQGYNLFGVNNDSGLSGATPMGTDLVPDAGLLIGNIIGGLANNGGPTLTHLPIAGSSPAINTGDNGLLAGLTEDQRGGSFLRIQPAAGAVDIGAVEDPTGQVNLTVIKAGSGDGIITSTPAGLINCGAACVATFASADTVTLTATADGASNFTGWSGGGCSGIGTCVVTMNQARTVTATFGALVTFVVKNLNDSGPDSLRQAVVGANSTPGVDTIGFQAGLTGTITLTSGEIALSDDTILQGPGAGAITVSGGGLSRIFTIASGKTVNISGLTLSNGVAANDGGALVNNGNLTISDSAVSGNTAGWGGGGIANASSASILTIRNSTLSGNTANSGSSGHGGGAVFNYLGSVTVINSTVSGNAVPTNTGGGLDNYGSMTVTNSTITGNSASYGGGIYTENALTVGNSLIAGNSASVLGPEIRVAGGIFTSQGYNLFGENGAHGLSGTGITPKADPDGDLVLPGAISTAIITTLANNGGSTLTHLPVTDSLVINTGSDGLTPGAITTDQRDAARRIGSAVDIGAVEDLNGANVHLLKVIRAGTGSGTVTDGSRINCGEACLANFTGGPSVTLTAVPKADSTFTGWSGGGCSGIGTSCVVSMTSAQNVTASFDIGTSFVVTNLNDSGPGSLRQVIASANAVPGANPITFETGLTGIISLTTGEIAITDDATIDGPGTTNLTISGNNASRIFTVESGKTVSITKLTLANGLSANPGGAILNNGNLTISESALSNNQSTLTGSFNGGGAIANTDTGVLTVMDSSLTGNTGVVGGAINNQIGGTTTVRNSTLSGNTGNGGGVYSRGTLTIETSTVSGNTSTGDGGGIHAWDGTLTMMESTVANNTAAAGGGGIASGTATLVVRNSTLSGNTANSGSSGHGGGGLFNLGGTVQVINSTVSGNSVPTNTGGGLDNYGSMTVVNSTITGNSASYGGGIYSMNPLTVGNSLIAGNSASVLGPEIRIDGSSFTSQGHNLFGVNGVSGLSGASAIPNASDITPQAGIFINDLIEVLNNSGGGRTETHLLKLVCLPTSESCTEPAINAGSNALIPAGVITDQRGAGFPRILNDIVDIGAVEDARGIVIKHLLTVTRAGTGSGAVNSGAADITCGSDCTESYPTNTAVTLTATPASDSRFLGWTGDCVGANPTCTVTISRAKKVTATFEPMRHVLAVAQIGVGHGVITSAMPGIACGSDCIEIYAPGTTVTLTAAADADSSFGGWSGACSGVGSCTVLLGNNQVVAATFNLMRHILMVSKAGAGIGTVTSTTTGIDCGSDCGEAYVQGTSVTLIASAADGSTFTGWSGACSGTASCQVTMTAAHNITATFNPATAPQ